MAAREQDLAKQFQVLEAASYDYCGRPLSGLRALVQVLEASDDGSGDLGVLLEYIADDLEERLAAHHEDMMALLERITKAVQPAEHQAA